MAAAATLIGGAFLSATVQTLVEKLASTEFLDYIRNTKLNDSLLRKLQTTLLTLQAVLDDAEERQINNLAVKKWLDDLKDAVLDAEDLVNEISYDSLRCKMENRQAGSRTNQVWNLFSSPLKNFYRDINSQLKIMCETLEPFALHKDTLGLQTKSARVSRRPPSSSGVNESAMVGRNDDKDTIIKMLVSECGTSKNNNLGVVAILGMGGVGKTTLAQLVYNDEKVEQHFDFKVWVCVSEDFDVVRVTKSLLESVVRNTPISLKSLQINLYGGTSFPSWLGNSLFSNMVSLSIQNCEYCTTLPPLGQLPSLKKLRISNLLLLEKIGPEFYCVEEGECSNSTFQPFPSLEHLGFNNMPNWQDWLPFEGVNFAFPRLKTMELRNCLELRGDLPSHLSCMEEIENRRLL